MALSALSTAEEAGKGQGARFHAHVHNPYFSVSKGKDGDGTGKVV